MGHNMSEKQEHELARAERGAQLRALIVSWDEDKTFIQALSEQQEKIDAGAFTPAEDWAIMADEILGAYMSRPKMEWPEEKPDDGPKIITP